MNTSQEDSSIEKLAQEFLSYLDLEKGRAANTCIAYQRDLSEFLNYCHSKRVNPLEVGLKELQGFLAKLRRRNLSQRSLARKLTTVKQFYKFLLIEEQIDSDPSELLSVSVKARSLPKLLTEKEMKALIEAAAGDTQEEVRDRALLELWYATGCRISELTGLEIRNFDWTQGLVKVMGKGQRERMIPVHKTALAWCKRYKTIRHQWLQRTGLKQAEMKVFFLTREGRAFTRQSMWKLVKRYAERAKIKKNIWPHMIRHTFATHVLKGGADLRAIQELLGHRSISTTEVYTHLDVSSLKAMQLKYHPRN